MSQKIRVAGGLIILMERLIYSNSIPSNLHLKRIPFLPQPARFSTPIHHLNKLTKWSGVKSLSCNYQDPSSNYLSIPSKSDDSTHYCALNLSSSLDSMPDGSSEKFNILRKVLESLTQQQKVFNFTGTCFFIFYLSSRLKFCSMGSFDEKF